MKTIKQPMEHWDSSRICADCVNKDCKGQIFGHDFMSYSRDCERYDCAERMIEVEDQNA